MRIILGLQDIGFSQEPVQNSGLPLGCETLAMAHIEFSVLNVGHVDC